MLFKERQELRENAKFVLILINPLPLHPSPQFPINNGKFTLELFVTGRSKMLWSVVTSEGNKKNRFILYGNFYKFFKEYSDFSPLYKVKI